MIYLNCQGTLPKVVGTINSFRKFDLWLSNYGVTKIQELFCFKVKFVFFSKRFGLHKVFRYWSKVKSVVKSCHVGGVVFFQQRFWSAGRLPNKACSGRVGFCAVYRHFSGFGLFSALGVLSRPAHPPLTQTVSPFLANDMGY